MNSSETIRVVLDAADVERGARLADALRVAESGSAVFVVAPDESVNRAQLRSGGPDRDGIPEVSALSVGDVLRNLQHAGVVSVRTVLSERSEAAYLSDGRTLTAVRVLRPFRLVDVVYRWSRPGLLRCAGEWDVVRQTDVVPEGCYLAGLVGDMAPMLLGASGVDTDDVAVLLDWVAGLDGFGASRADATCSRCGGHWRADAGSWNFQPVDDCRAAAWEYADAEGFDTESATITCPACGTGRVGFRIFWQRSRDSCRHDAATRFRPRFFLFSSAHSRMWRLPCAPCSMSTAAR